MFDPLGTRRCHCVFATHTAQPLPWTFASVGQLILPAGRGRHPPRFMDVIELSTVDRPIVSMRAPATKGIGSCERGRRPRAWQAKARARREAAPAPWSGPWSATAAGAKSAGSGRNLRGLLDPDASRAPRHAPDALRESRR